MSEMTSTEAGAAKPMLDNSEETAKHILTSIASLGKIAASPDTPNDNVGALSERLKDMTTPYANATTGT